MIQEACQSLHLPKICITCNDRFLTYTWMECIIFKNMKANIVYNTNMHNSSIFTHVNSVCHSNYLILNGKIFLIGIGATSLHLKRNVSYGYYYLIGHRLYMRNRMKIFAMFVKWLK